MWLETTRRGASRVDVALAFFIDTLGDLLVENPYVVPFNHSYILNGVPLYLYIYLMYSLIAYLCKA